MSETKNPEPNPLISDLSLVETSFRAYIVNTRRSLTNTERILRQDPRTSRELDRTGGLGNLLTQSGNQNRERNYLSRFINFQTSLFIDRVTQGDILRTPSLESLFEEARENTNISISISTELESCCAEIKSKLDDLSLLIRDQFRRLRTLIIRSEVSLEDQASANFKSLTDTSLSTREQLLTLLNRRFNIIEEIINQTKTFILDKINQRSDSLESILRSNLINILNSLTVQTKEITDQTRTLLNALKSSIQECFESLLFSIESCLTTQTGALIAAMQAFYNVRVLPLLSGIATGIGEIIAATTYVSDIVTKILTQVKVLPKIIEDLLDTKFEDLKTYLSDWKKDLIKEISEEVSLQIVGESYYKWDSVTTYYPTVTFLFKEEEVSQYPRKSQIKLRLPKKNEELTELDINVLKTNCNLILNASYCYGTQRFNYVSTDKRFKTTVFGDNSSQIKALFNSLFKVINEPFEERNLSITTSRSRLNQTKRKSPLSEAGLNTISYDTSFNVKFKKAVLLVNGLKRPIVLAES